MNSLLEFLESRGGLLGFMLTMAISFTVMFVIFCVFALAVMS